MRIIARLDVKNEYVIKGIHFEGLRKVGDPNRLARRYYEEGVDEILMVDAVASLYQRNHLFATIRRATREVFVPLTLGGGLRTLDDVGRALDAGADKIAVNTAAIDRPEFVSEVAHRYGSQCMVASVQAKRCNGSWLAYKETGRERTTRDILEWVQELEGLGAGELLVTSVDQEGTRRGFDVELLERVNERVSIPVMASGGYGAPEHLRRLMEATDPSGVCFASVLHYNISSIAELRSVAAAAGKV